MNEQIRTEERQRVVKLTQSTYCARTAQQPSRTSIAQRFRQYVHLRAKDKPIGRKAAVHSAPLRSAHSHQPPLAPISLQFDGTGAVPLDLGLCARAVTYLNLRNLRLLDYASVHVCMVATCAVCRGRALFTPVRVGGIAWHRLSSCPGAH